MKYVKQNPWILFIFQIDGLILTKSTQVVGCLYNKLDKEIRNEEAFCVALTSPSFIIITFDL